MEMEKISNEGPIEDEDVAREGAFAEKPLRDNARDESLEITSEEKAVLDRIAARVGEKAIKEFEAEREKEPRAQLLGIVEKASHTLRELGGHEKDLEILGKLTERIGWWFDDVAEIAERYRNEFGKNATMNDFRNEPMNDSFRPCYTIRVFEEVGDRGGRVFGRGNHKGLVSPERGEMVRREEDEKGRGIQFLNYSMSQVGQTELYRALGVLQQGETALDLPKIAENAKREEYIARGGQKEKANFRIDPKEYSEIFPTGFPHIFLYVHRKPPKGEQQPKEIGAALYLSEKAFDALLAK